MNRFYIFLYFFYIISDLERDIIIIMFEYDKISLHDFHYY